MSPIMTGMRPVLFQLNFAPKQGDRFAAQIAAEAWCTVRGISVGRLQSSAPRGLLFGKFDIQKWRNLTVEERDSLHGKIAETVDGGAIIQLLAIPDDFGVIASTPAGAAAGDVADGQIKGELGYTLEKPPEISVTAERLAELRQWAVDRALQYGRDNGAMGQAETVAYADKLLAFVLKGEVQP